MEQIEKIANSIKEFGFINPVLIDGDFGIIAGHGRVEGAKQLGMSEVPCVFVEDLTNEQKRAYILADNKLADMAGWDFAILDKELAEISIDMGDFGFESVDIDFNHIEDLISEDFIEKREDKSEFSITFIFPTEKKDIINAFINDNGKETIVDFIIERIERGEE